MTAWNRETQPSLRSLPAYSTAQQSGLVTHCWEKDSHYLVFIIDGIFQIAAQQCKQGTLEEEWRTAFLQALIYFLLIFTNYTNLWEHQFFGRESSSQTTTIFQLSYRKPTQQEAKHNSCSRAGVWLPCEAETSGRFVSASRGSAGLPGFCQLPALDSIYIAFCKPCLREEGACPLVQGAALLGHLPLWAKSFLDKPVS